MSKIIERRIHKRSNSFVLTIPPEIIDEMGLKDGQSVRFTIGDGEFVVRPAGADPPTSGARRGGQFERAAAEMTKDEQR